MNRWLYPSVWFHLRSYLPQRWWTKRMFMQEFGGAGAYAYEHRKDRDD